MNNYILMKEQGPKVKVKISVLLLPLRYYKNWPK